MKAHLIEPISAVPAPAIILVSDNFDRVDKVYIIMRLVRSAVFQSSTLDHVLFGYIYLYV